jgi:biotin carboxyl carrier protein
MSSIRANVRLGDRVREVSLDRRGERVTARVDGREYRLSILEPRRGVYSFMPADGGGRSTEAVVQENGGLFRVRLRDRFFEASLEVPGRSAGGLSSGAGESGPQVLKALMPGRVVRILVEPGAKVQRGQGILVIEAMKMENEIGSPKEGVVKEILASPDDRVDSGASLAVID